MSRERQDIVDGLWEIVEYQNRYMVLKEEQNTDPGHPLHGFYDALGPMIDLDLQARANTLLALAVLDKQKLTQSDEIVDMCREIESYGRLYRDSAIVKRAKDIRAAIEKE